MEMENFKITDYKHSAFRQPNVEQPNVEQPNVEQLSGKKSDGLSEFGIWVRDHPKNYTIQKMGVGIVQKSFKQYLDSPHFIQCLICPRPVTIKVTQNSLKLWNNHLHGPM